MAFITCEKSSALKEKDGGRKNESRESDNIPPKSYSSEDAAGFCLQMNRMILTVSYVCGGRGRETE